jgi:hypothetical protein
MDEFEEEEEIAVGDLEEFDFLYGDPEEDEVDEVRKEAEQKKRASQQLLLPPAVAGGATSPSGDGKSGGAAAQAGGASSADDIGPPPLEELRCGVCAGPMDLSRFYEHEGSPLCEPCYLKMFCSCHDCSKVAPFSFPFLLVLALGRMSNPAEVVLTRAHAHCCRVGLV